MKKIAFLKYLRSVHPLGAALTVCGVLIALCAALFFGFWAYMSADPRIADMEKDLWSVQHGKAKPNNSGLVASAKNMMYVTRAANGSLVVLWPYNLAHDDNYFEGFLFSDIKLNSNKVSALGPTRGGSNGYSKWLTHLTVDRTINEHWYHVQGEMYK